jgi:hypothetical protein
MTDQAAMTDQGAGPQDYERDLDDAAYYLERGCAPCAERYFSRARRHGASEEDIVATTNRANARATPETMTSD